MANKEDGSVLELERVSSVRYLGVMISLVRVRWCLPSTQNIILNVGATRIAPKVGFLTVQSSRGSFDVHVLHHQGRSFNKWLQLRKK